MAGKKQSILPLKCDPFFLRPNESAEDMLGERARHSMPISHRSVPHASPARASTRLDPVAQPVHDKWLVSSV